MTYYQIASLILLWGILWQLMTIAAPYERREYLRKLRERQRREAEQKIKQAEDRERARRFIFR